MITISTYLKNPAEFLSPYSNESENKNNIASCLWSIFDRTDASTEKCIPHMKALILSYFDPEGHGRGIPIGAPPPHPLKIFISFLCEVVEAMWGWWSEKIMLHIKSPHLTILKIIDFGLQCHEKMFFWNASIWVGGPCRIKIGRMHIILCNNFMIVRLKSLFHK